MFPSGLSTRGYANSDLFSRYYHFAKDSLNHKAPLRSLANGALASIDLLPANQSETAGYFSSKFLSWQKERTKPWAAFINLMDTHTPYYTKSSNRVWGSRREEKIQDQIDQHLWDFVGGNRPWWQRSSLESLYDDTVRRVDSAMEQIVTTLKKRGEYENTLIVFAGDHGEGFGEESRIRNGERVSEHSQGIHEVLLHVPLLVKFPHQSDQHSLKNVVSLTKFPDVVQSSINGSGEPNDFVSDNPVLAVGPGVDRRPGMLKNAKAYCGDRYENFTGDAYAIYTDSGKNVRKQIIWKDKYAEVLCESAQKSYRTEKTGQKSDVDNIIERINDREIISKKSDLDVDESVSKRLKELGYR